MTHLLGLGRWLTGADDEALVALETTLGALIQLSNDCTAAPRIRSSRRHLKQLQRLNEISAILIGLLYVMF
jgi:hypothetical protein